jgi:putative hydrolase of the HAD superfamily
MITTIIFDFAGVVSLRSFFPVVAENLSKKYGVAESDIEQRLRTHVMQYMLGKESTEEFWEKVCEGFDIPYQGFVEIFSSSYGLNPEVIILIKDLKPRYQILLHSDNFNALSQTLRQDPGLEGLFEKMYFSDEIHLIKEDEASFRHVLQDAGKRPEECVFIDDNEINLVAPRNIGIRTVLFKDVNSLREKLGILGVA